MTHPVILGHPWLTKHNPNFDWVKGQVTSWGKSCQESCFFTVSSTISNPDLKDVPVSHHNLAQVFSKAKAKSLLPHHPYDCGIDFLPGSIPPRGRLYSLSAPERYAMDTHIKESLEAGIRPSSSPAGAGFFFVEKDKTLCHCIDYRGLNDIIVKNSYPLPLISTVFELLEGAHYVMPNIWFVSGREMSGRLRLILPVVSMSIWLYLSDAQTHLRSSRT